METLNILNTKLNIDDETLKRYIQIFKKIENTDFAMNDKSSRKEIEKVRNDYYSGGYDNLRKDVEWLLRDMATKYMASNLKKTQDRLDEKMITFGTGSKLDYNSAALSAIGASGGYFPNLNKIYLDSNFVFINIINKNYCKIINTVIHECTHHIQRVYDNELINYSDKSSKIMKESKDETTDCYNMIDKNYDKYIEIFEEVINPFLDYVYNNQEPLKIEGEHEFDKQKYIIDNLYFDSINERNARELAAIHTTELLHNAIELDKELDNGKINVQLDQINKEAEVIEFKVIDGENHINQNPSFVKAKKQIADLSANDFGLMYDKLERLTTSDFSQYAHKIRYSIMSIYLSKQGNREKLIKYAKKYKELSILVDLSVLDEDIASFNKYYKKMNTDRILNQFLNISELNMLIKCDKKGTILQTIEEMANITGNMHLLNRLKLSGYDLVEAKSIDDLFSNCKLTVKELLEIGCIDAGINLLSCNISYLQDELFGKDPEEVDNYERKNNILCDFQDTAEELINLQEEKSKKHTNVK